MMWPFGRGRRASKEWDSPETDPLNASVQEVINQIPVDFGGGCPPKKAYALAWLIREGRLRTSLDIGVWRGRSLMPQAVAHRDYTGGVAYGVDPYTNAAAVQRDNVPLREKLDRFVEATDFERLYGDVLALRENLGLSAHCRLERKTSEEAAADFAARGLRFGLIHVDGNHDTKHVVRDVELYWPLLAPEGFLVLDDISWASVKPAVDLAASKAELLFSESLPAVTELDYAVFWSGHSPRKAEALRESLKRIRG